MATRAPAHHIAGLDGLRAIAVMLVIVSHYGLGYLVPGAFGVTIFFAISGYLITGLLLAERARWGNIDLKRFFGRRMLRLLPELLGFLIVLSVLSVALLDAPMTLRQFAAGLFYFANYQQLLAPACTSCADTGHLWSLAVEEHFYLLWPGIVLLLGGRPRLLLSAILAVLAWGVAYRAWGMANGITDTYLSLATEARVDSIVWGCLVAWIQFFRPALRDRLARQGPLLFVFGIALILASLLYRDPDFRGVLRFTFQGAGLAAIFMALLWNNRFAPLVSLLDLPVMTWLGRLSYGAYLWHILARDLVAASFALPSDWSALPLGQHGLVMALAIGLTLAMAHASYRWLFLPCQRWRKFVVRSDTAPAHVGARARAS